MASCPIELLYTSNTGEKNVSVIGEGAHCPAFATRAHRSPKENTRTSPPSLRFPFFPPPTHT